MATSAPPTGDDPSEVHVTEARTIDVLDHTDAPASAATVPPGVTRWRLVAIVGSLAVVAVAVVGALALLDTGERETPLEPGTSGGEGSIERPAPPSALLILEALDSDNILAYQARDGVELIDLSSGRVVRVDQNATGLAALAPFVLMFDEFGRTLAVHPSDPGLVRLLLSWGRVVANAQEDDFVFVRPDGGGGATVIVGRLDAAFIGTPLDVSDAEGLIEVPGLGVLSVTPEGTYIASPREFTLLTEAEVVAASAGARVERDCTGTACDLTLVNDALAERIPLPGGFAASDQRLLVSPDGRWVMGAGDSGAAFFDALTTSTTALATPPPAGASPTWAPDSSHVLWLDGEDAPLLHVAFTDDRPPLAIDVSTVGGSPVAGAQLVVVGPASE